MNMRSPALVLLATLTLLPLAAPVQAGHVVFDIDPCGLGRDGTAPPAIGEGVQPCRNGEPVPDCWTYGREGEPVLVADPARCPAEADASCLASGLLVRILPVGFESQVGRAAAQATVGGAASADAAQQRAALAGWVEEATLAGECAVDLATDCDARAHAEAAGVSLLNGLVTASLLEADVSLSCRHAPVQETRFVDLVIGGVPMDPVVHHGSRVVVPGVGVVTFGTSDAWPTPTGGMGMSATALRIDLVDARGAPLGVVLVGHAAAQLG